MSFRRHSPWSVSQGAFAVEFLPEPTDGTPQLDDLRYLTAVYSAAGPPQLLENIAHFIISDTRPGLQGAITPVEI